MVRHLRAVAVRLLGRGVDGGGGMTTKAHPLPDDYATVGKHMTVAAAAGHYGVGKWSIAIWDRQIGHRRRKFSAPGAPARRRGFTQQPIDRPYNPVTVPERAAEYLRRFGAVTRVNSRGEYDPAGQHWMRGGSSKPFSADEIVARAVRNGFRAEP